VALSIRLMAAIIVAKIVNLHLFESTVINDLIWKDSAPIRKYFNSDGKNLLFHGSSFENSSDALIKCSKKNENRIRMIKDFLLRITKGASK
jgi:hypothetical protein